VCARAEKREAGGFGLRCVFQKPCRRSPAKLLNIQPRSQANPMFQKEVFWERSFPWPPISDDTQTRD